MSRPRIDVAVPPLGLRRAEAAAAIGISIETFDEYVRPHLPVARVGSIRVYPVAALNAWLQAEATSPIDDLARGHAA
ncbi:MAG: hypothetical protein M3P44_16330 [Actinomycetota bacterium]|nr:hypothetical protein [Actinomycetota bacterium]